MQRILIILVILLAAITSQAVEARDKYVLNGIIIDTYTGKPLPYATVRIYGAGKLLRGTVSDEAGKFRFGDLPDSRFKINITYIGYEPWTKVIRLKSDKTIIIQLNPATEQIGEVVVVASEKKGLTSESVIGKTAMEHLQPSSFADIMSLLPGGMTHIPTMSGPRVVRLRETGIGSGQYATSSLGTKFIIDGAALATDANMQRISGAYQGSDDSNFNHSSYGVDMRSIPTDNIEKVEIVRGIPSVRYGNLTSGMVKITRKMNSTPLEARFKADGYGKLFSIGKGVTLPGRRNLNLDGGLLFSRRDPRIPQENFNRLNFSARYRRIYALGEGTLRHNVSADYGGTLDKVKTDREAQVCLDDKYQSYYHRVSLSNTLKYNAPEVSFIKSVLLRYSLSQSFDVIKQTKTVSVDRDHVVTTLDHDGTADGVFLPRKYIASHKVDGRPFYSDLRLQAEAEVSHSIFKHELIAGTQWTYSKNYGRGQVYDIFRPIDGNTSRKPREYRDIPATSILSVYAEDNIGASIGRHKFMAEAGVRSSMMTNVSSSFALHNKPTFDPRFNLRWDFPVIGKLSPWLSIGLGRMTMMPTIKDLYQETLYYDITQLYYWNMDPAKKRVNYRTYVVDRNNYGLKSAHNDKFELRAGFDAGGHHFSITYFYERMNDGFRHMTRVRPLEYTKYDKTAIISEELDGPPSLEGLPSVQDTILGSYRAMGNGSGTTKEGVEFQYTSPRIPVIHTRVTFNGAWFHSIYDNSRPEYYAGLGAVVGGIPVNNKYVGLYDETDYYDKKRFTTNLILDTYLEKTGLIISTTAEAFLFGKKYIPAGNPFPSHYMGTDGKIYKYTEESEKDTMLQWLRRGGRNVDMRGKDKYYVLFNFKATKKFGSRASLSFFADRIFSIAPTYNAGDFVIRRSFSPYFGMELNLKI